MGRRRPAPDNEGGPTLKDVRVAIIEVQCAVCDRRDQLDRKVLVKQFGAGISFKRLRRHLSMGCERMCHPEGDRCGTKFPCLDTEHSLKPTPS